MADYIRSLEELDRNSLAEAGGKGANLGELVRAGLPVPPGFTVTAPAYRAHLESAGLRERIARRLRGVMAEDLATVTAASEEIAAWIRETPVPESIRDAVRKAYADLAKRIGACQGGLAVAVRSSATAEDLPTASFAGQQETFLNVCGAEAVLEHMRMCWASLWTPQAVSYRASMGVDHLKVDLAVVVQAMVPAEVAGVMFTANPVSGARDEILVSASYGLGEAVVSGAVTPDTFVLDSYGAARQRTLGTKAIRIVAAERGTRTEPVPAEQQARYCLSDRDLVNLAALARRVEEHYGSPQDTEWALAGGRLYLLQARPITTLAGAQAPAAADEPYGCDRPPRGIEDAMEHFPEPLSPLDIAAYCMGDRAFQAFAAELGVRPSRRPSSPLERRDGRIGVRLGQPRPSLALLWRLPARMIREMRSDPMPRWRQLSAEMTAAQESLGRKADSTQSPTALAQVWLEALDRFESLLAKRFSLCIGGGVLYALLLGFWTRWAVGKAAAAELTDRLLRAVPFRTALMSQDVARLARVAAAAGRESPQFQAALAEFLQTWGNRPSRGMVPLISTPTWREDSSTLLDLVDTLLADAAAPAPEEEWRRQEADYMAARAEAESRLGWLGRRWFCTTLERARAHLIIREDSLYLMEGLTALLRRIALRLGRLLAEQGVLAEPGDVVFLLESELVPVAAGKLEVRDRVDLRKRAFAGVRAAHERGQHWMIATGTIPPLPPKARKQRRGAAAGGLEVTGLAASRGEAEGTVCLVRGPQDFGKLRKGDILVAPFTAPIWTPLFRVAAAVVTDVGSPVSHAAIVAREYGIPAVVATGNATTQLKDGQTVRVDGTRGVVSVLRQNTRE